MSNHYRLFTDGACKGNPGPGGWAAVVVDPSGNKTILSGNESHTTNNRMELIAAIKGLESLPTQSSVVLTSDSSYLVNTMTVGWKRKINNDLWTSLDHLVLRLNIQWEWVKGHSGHPENEEANDVAQAESNDINAGVTTSKLTHTDEAGKASMVDVGTKEITAREAIAKGSILMEPTTLALIESNELKKGDALGVARIAGIMGAKLTPQLIPLCHPIPIEQIIVELAVTHATSSIEITGTGRTNAKTGIEMEVLVAVSIAALTIYDMAKAVDRTMRINAIRLISKTGGQHGDFYSE
jgi:cyclic pyranopterin phosphate synthase